MKNRINKIKLFIKNISRDQGLIIILSCFLLTLAVRIFYLQVIMWGHYQELIAKQNFWSTDIMATRWDIYISDKSNNPIKLTENIERYNIFVDTKFIPDKKKFIDLLSPILFEHFCIQNGNNAVDKLWCIKNIEKFTNSQILPEDPELFFKLDWWLHTWYIYSWQFIPLTDTQLLSTGYRYVKLVTWYIYSGTIDQISNNQNKIRQKYQEDVAQILSWTDSGQIISLIWNRLDALLYTWTRDSNFFRFIDNDLLIDDLQNANILGMKIINNHYIYFYPNEIGENNKKQIKKTLETIFDKYGDSLNDTDLDNYLSPQQNRYISIAKWINSKIFFEIDQLKNLYTIPGFLNAVSKMNISWRKVEDQWWYIEVDTNIYTNKSDLVNKLKSVFGDYWFTITDNAITKILTSIKPAKYKIFPQWIPLFHGLWSEKDDSRYYPNNSLLSNVIWYLDNDGVAHWWIEKFFDEQLAGKNGKIIWIWASWLGEVWSNDFEITPKTDGNNIYLTVDAVIQKEVEKILKFYQEDFRADSVSAIIINPYNGKIISMANYPDYNPNDISDVYNLKPLEISNRYILDDETQLDTPVYYQSGTKLVEAWPEIRKNLTIPKYIYKNIYWPKVLIDKNISLPYEPGSVFKWFTVGIWLDSDEIALTDQYYDKWSLTIDDFKISNVASACLGTNSFLHALQFSCNVWMIRIIQKIWQWTYYNYLEKLGFGKETWIELANEDAGFVADPNNNSKARFYNNSFWLWVLVTPLQLAAWYSTLVNWWYYIKPTIIDKITNSDGQTIYKYEKPDRIRVLKTETSEAIKYALFQVVNWWQIKKFSIPWYTLGGKTGTAQIAYKWIYREWAGWTNGSFAWIITKNNLKYVVVIQIRRPRKSLRWELTAGKIFWDIAKYIISYEWIKS